MQKQFAHIIVLLSTIGLAGCVVADQYGSRAVAYNTQASATRNQVLLLNILRSAYREPLMFTDLPSVTGSATATGGFGTVLPLGGSSSGYQINPIASLSGGPTFNLVTLNTKEFYSGMLTPIPITIIASYIAQNRPLNMLASLFFNDITITMDGQTTKYYSSTNQPEKFIKFQNLVAELQDAGFTSQPTNPDQGPYNDIDTVAALPAAGMRMTKYRKDNTDKALSIPATTASKKDHRKKATAKATTASKGKTKTATAEVASDDVAAEILHDNWHIELKQPDLMFCFDPPKKFSYKDLKYLSQTIVEPLLCKSSQFRPTASSVSRKNTSNNIKFTIRSTLGVIYHLGELVRPSLAVPSNVPMIGQDILFRIAKNEEQ